MTCAWKELLAILPPWMRQETDKLGKERAQELRLRSNAPPEMITGTGSLWLRGTVSAADLQFVVNTASRYSPWAAETMAQGYLTAPGGHRIGLCGEAVCRNGTVTGIRQPDSLCIRIARDFPEIGKGIPMEGSILILGAPGWGKTTLLRDCARILSQENTVVVADERGELFPPGLPRGKRMDVLSLCPKTEGIDRILRTMGPDYIAVDEITAQQDCEALVHVFGCGVKLLASAHASSLEDLKSRSIYLPLIQHRLFDHILLLNREKQWHPERSLP